MEWGVGSGGEGEKETRFCLFPLLLAPLLPHLPVPTPHSPPHTPYSPLPPPIRSRPTSEACRCIGIEPGDARHVFAALRRLLRGYLQREVMRQEFTSHPRVMRRVFRTCVVVEHEPPPQAFVFGYRDEPRCR